MPWRKYKPRKGKHGPVYHIAEGVQVRRNDHGKWIIFINKGGERKSKTIGSGREDMIKAIRVAETIAEQISKPPLIETDQQPPIQAPTFKSYSEEWLNVNSGRWDKYTYERYEIILRLHLWPYENFRDKRLDEIARRDNKETVEANAAKLFTVNC